MPSPHDWRASQEQCSLAGTRTNGFVNMNDIKFFVAERSNRPQRAGQIWGDGSDRTVSEGGDTRAQ